jgi:SSS family solute:Na+ symporter
MPPFEPRNLQVLDYLLILGYFGVNIFIGWWCGRKRKTEGSYFLGRKIPWWALGISFYASATSSISYMALPAKTFADNWLVIGTVPAQVAATLVIAFYFVKLLRRLDVTTIFEYLDRRFGRTVRMLGAFLALLVTTMSRMSVVLLLPSLALAAVTGINVYLAIALMGIVTIIYSTEGGFDAVVWTEVLQALVMFGGIGLALHFLMSGIEGGVAEVLTAALREDKFEMLSWEPTLAAPTVWVFLGMFVATVFVQISDQSLMQRVFASADERAARKTLILGTFLGVPSVFLFFFMGTAIWAFYQANPTHFVEGVTNDAIFPYFIANELPVGVVGLIIAGLLAATMSTLSGAINASAAIVERDFYRPFRPDATEKQRLAVGRWASVLSGTVATVMAIYLATLDVRSLWEKFIELTALFGGAFPGVFALGLLTRRASTAGAVAGVIASIGTTLWVQNFMQISVFFHGFIALTVCFVVGLLVSLFFPARPRDLTGLTLFTLGRPLQPAPSTQPRDDNPPPTSVARFNPA